MGGVLIVVEKRNEYEGIVYQVHGVRYLAYVGEEPRGIAAADGLDATGKREAKGEKQREDQIQKCIAGETYGWVWRRGEAN